MAIYNAIITNLNKNEVKRYAGIRHSEDFPQKYINQACLEARLLAKPKGVFKEYDYDASTNTILSNPPLLLTGKSITKHLEKASKVFVLSATVGEAIEEKSNAFFRNNEYTLGLLIDAAATTAVEEVADQINAYLDKLAKKQGYKSTWRFSPGYGDWPIEVQKDLAQIIGTEEIGVTVTESFTLFPRKSITAIIGLQEELSLDKKLPGCPSCTKTDCSLRK